MRERKTGPKHPLIVIHCGTHGRCFSVYPPGFAPYLRASLDPTADKTVFGAARDAVDQTIAAWPRRVRGPRRPGRYWRTQTRQIAFAMLVVGLSGGEGSDGVADVLGVPLHVHRKAACGVVPGGFRQRGRAVVDVLDEARSARGRPRPLVSRLYEAGFLAGLWGRAWRVGRSRGGTMLHPMFRA